MRFFSFDGEIYGVFASMSFPIIFYSILNQTREPTKAISSWKNRKTVDGA
jgi:hypothetical protein